MAPACADVCLLAQQKKNTRRICCFCTSKPCLLHWMAHAHVATASAILRKEPLERRTTMPTLSMHASTALAQASPLQYPPTRGPSAALALAMPCGAQDPLAEAALTVDPLSGTVTVPQTEALTDPADTVTAAAVAKPGLKVGPRTVSTVSTSKAGQLTGPVSQPLAINWQVKLPVGSLPKMLALTKSQMERQYTGAAAPAAFHSARTGERNYSG